MIFNDPVLRKKQTFAMSEDEWDMSDSEVPVVTPKVASKWDDEDVEEEDVKVEASASYFILNA